MVRLTGYGIHSYEVQKIEVLDNDLPSTSNGVGTQIKDLSAYPLAKLLKGVEKSYDKGKYLLDESKKRSDGVRFFRTANGEAYGFTVGGKIYIDPRIATSETPVHEYAHLWAEALRNGNPKEWQNVVELMKGTKVWDEVKARYPELKSDDEIADEVLATYSGRRGAERLRAEQRKIAEGNGGVFEKAEAVSALEKVKQALKKFRKGVADFLHIHYKSAEDVADRVMKDLLEGVDPRSMMAGGNSLRPETRVNIVEAKAEHGFKNYAEAKDWAKEHIARTYSGEDTGGKGDIRISNAAVDKYLSQSAVDKSDSKDVHLSVLKVLPEVIRESVDAEQHADFKKGKDGVRSAENGINPNVTIHRLYGAVRMGGRLYRVKVTLKEDKTSKEPKVPHSYEATKIELFAGTLGNSDNSLSPNTNNSITAAKLLKGVEKSYGGGKFFEDYNKVREQFIGEKGAERADHAEDVERRRDIPGDYWRDIQGVEGNVRAMAVKKANDRFNEELELQVKGKLAEGHIYKLGLPSEILLSTGVPNLPIELSAKQLSKKAANRGHRFDVKDIANLPQAIQAPIAVFEYGNKDKSQNLIVEIERDGKKFVVGIHFNQNRRGIVVNDIRGLFNKDSHEWLNWISQGKLLYADKEKIQALIDKQRTNLAEVNYLNLDDVVKKVKDFENPKLFGEEIIDDGKKGSDSIDRSVRENPKNEDKPRFSRKPGERSAREGETKYDFKGEDEVRRPFYVFLCESKEINDKNVATYSLNINDAKYTEPIRFVEISPVRRI